MVRGAVGAKRAICDKGRGHGRTKWYVEGASKTPWSKTFIFCFAHLHYIMPCTKR